MAAVWAVISKQEGGANDGGLEVEFFSVRPRTPDVGGEEGNWPSAYLVYEGNVDGGDSILVGCSDWYKAAKRREQG